MKLFAYLGTALSLLIAPILVRAQTPSFNGGALGSYTASIIEFINRFLIPFIWAIAFVVFIWGVFLYFIAGGANEEQRDKGKQLVFWGITAFVVMSCLWGLVNLLTNTFGFGGYNNPRPPSFSPTGQPATQNAPANTGSGNTPFNASGNAPAN